MRCKEILVVVFLVFSLFGIVRPQAKYELEGNMLKLPGPILFETGSETIRTVESRESLEHVRDYLSGKKYITVIRIEVHGQRSGNEEELQSLTEKRALSVANWLVENGIDCKRILPVGFGSTKPLVDPSGGPGALQNNRVEFHNAELMGRAIGGMPLDGGGKAAGGFCKNPN